MKGLPTLAARALVVVVTMAFAEIANTTVYGAPALWRKANRLVLVEKGRPKAVIVVPNPKAPAGVDERTADPATARWIQSDKSIQAAAEGFQRTIEQMTGAKLPIRTEKEFAGQGIAVLVGQSDLAKAKGIDLKQDVADRDHYLFKTGKDFVALVGSDDQLAGTPYAVYDLLQRLGCGWFGPATNWVVIPKMPTITVPGLNVDERPAYCFRSIWMVSTPELKYAWRLGGNRFRRGGA